MSNQIAQYSAGSAGISSKVAVRRSLGKLVERDDAKADITLTQRYASTVPGESHPFFTMYRKDLSAIETDTWRTQWQLQNSAGNSRIADSASRVHSASDTVLLVSCG
jgi:hypothetical protein